MRTIEPNLERQEQRRKIRDYLTGQPDGAKIGWLDITKTTGVELRTNAERQWVRDILGSMDREYIAIAGFGIELSSAENARELVDGRVAKIRGVVERANDSAENVSKRHAAQMSAADAAYLTRQKAQLATISLSADSDKPPRGGLAVVPGLKR